MKPRHLGRFADGASSGSRLADRNSPRSGSGGVVWRVRALCGPQFATVRVGWCCVAGSGAVRTAIRHGRGGVALCGGFGCCADRNSPRSGWGGVVWRVWAVCGLFNTSPSPEQHDQQPMTHLSGLPLDTCLGTGQLCADRNSPRPGSGGVVWRVRALCGPQFATVGVGWCCVAGSGAVRTAIRHGRGRVALCGGFGRCADRKSPRSGWGGVVWGVWAVFVVICCGRGGCCWAAGSAIWGVSRLSVGL
jgi:hypothetical protein